MASHSTGAQGLEAHAASLTLCAYCPSLCKHTCPVGATDGRETDTPWAMMSLVDHLRRGLIELDGDLATALYRCVGCGACTHACEHEVDVEAVLVDARAYVVAQGVTPYPRADFERAPLEDDSDRLRSLREVARFEFRPTFSLLPGLATLRETPEAVDALLAICERLDLDTISCGQVCQLDVGYSLWFSGYHTEFVAHARKVFAAVQGARELVVMSPEDLYMLTQIYPRFGLKIEAELSHTSEFLGPLLSGAVIERLDERVAYHGSCHLTHHLALGRTPRQVLERVLAQPLIDIASLGGGTSCCGSGGTLAQTSPETARRMAERVVALAIEAGGERLVSFSPRCVRALSEVAGDTLRVDHAVSLIAEAVAGEGELA